MTVCNFFLQGRCRYGEKCWNEHPRGGSRGGGGGGVYNNNNNFSRSSQQQQPRGGGGGFGNRVWVNPSQQRGGYIQPSSFSSHGSDDWEQGNGGRRDNAKAADFSFSSQNRFSALGTPSTFDRGGRAGGQQVTGGDEDDDKKLELIQADMDIWEKSRQWGFSCYSNFKTSLSGFSDHSPEEVRLEYYSSRASGDLQGYINGINHLFKQWRNRVQELKLMNPATRAALLAELNNPAPQASTGGFVSTNSAGFGSPTSSFGSKGFGTQAPVQASTFSFAVGSSAFGSSAAPSSSAGFGSSSGPTQPRFGFDSSSAAPSALSASSFSFTAPVSSAPAAASGFGSASGFSFSSTANTGGGGFGSAFGAKAPVAAGSSSIAGQTNGGFGTTSVPPAASTNGLCDSLYSPEDKLTPEELNQFKAKRFTLGQIPLKPPPANTLVV